MTGLEKITERILAEGRERARVILQQAEEDCTRIATDYAERTEVLRRDYAERGVTECEALVEKAKVDAAAMHEQIIEDAKSSVMAAVIEGAKQKLCSSREGKYRELMIALLSSALIEQDRIERERAEQGEELPQIPRFDVLMNSADHDILGTDVVDGARRLVSRRIGADKAARLVLAHERIGIDGGLVLRYGDIMVDCSIDTLLTRICEQMKGELEDVLFGD